VAAGRDALGIPVPVALLSRFVGVSLAFVVCDSLRKPGQCRARVDRFDERP